MYDLPTIWRAVREWPADQRLALARRLLDSVQREVRPRTDAAALAEMAADPQVQRELAEMAREFVTTDLDGLEWR